MERETGEEKVKYEEALPLERFISLATDANTKKDWKLLNTLHWKFTIVDTFGTSFYRGLENFYSYLTKVDPIDDYDFEIGLVERKEGPHTF